MTFDVIPGFFLHFQMGQRITWILGRAPPPKKKLEQRRHTLSMLIFLEVEKVVDVNHLRPSMLIFSMLLPHPEKTDIVTRIRHVETKIDLIFILYGQNPNYSKTKIVGSLNKNQ